MPLLRSLVLLSVIVTLTLLSACMPLTPPIDESKVGGGERSQALEKAVVYLVVQAQGPNAEMRANAIEALQPLQDRRVRGVLEQGLNDQVWVVRFASAMSAGKRRQMELKPLIQALLPKERNGSVRVAMIYALRRMGDTANMTTLAETLKSPDPEVRANTAMVLGLLGDPSARGLLETRSKESDVRAKFELTAALARLGDRSAQDVIIAMSVNKYAEDHYIAIATCPDLKRPEANTILLTALKDADQPGPMVEAKFNTVRAGLIASRSLAKLDSMQGLDLAKTYLTEPRPELRSLAVFALGDLLTPSNETVFANLLEDPDRHVRMAAAAGLVNVWSRAEQAATRPVASK